MVPAAYVVIYTEEKRRIFVVLSDAYGDFVLTKECRTLGCTCLGCMLCQATIHTCDGEVPVLNLESQKELGGYGVCVPFCFEQKKAAVQVEGAIDLFTGRFVA